MKNMFARASAATLLTLIFLFSVVLPVESQSITFQVTGYANVNGVPTNGVHVSSNGATYTTRNDANGNAGFYALMPPGITNGSSVTINFEYNGHTTSTTVTANGNSASASTVNIVNPTPTPVPSSTATPVPTTTSSGSSGTSANINYNGVKNTPTPKATPTVQATPMPTATPVPTQAPTSTPTPTAMPSGNNTTIYLAIGTIAVLAIAGAAYFLWKKK